MTKATIFASLACLTLAGMTAPPALAQTAPAQQQHVISLYRAAPGQQPALLRWLADRDRASAAAGLPPSQLYVHLDGDSWDYFLVAPATTPQQDEAVEAAARKLGLSAGPAAGIELRRYIAVHTDTIVAGPTTAADFLRSIGGAGR